MTRKVKTQWATKINSPVTQLTTWLASQFIFVTLFDFSALLFLLSKLIMFYNLFYNFLIHKSICSYLRVRNKYIHTLLFLIPHTMYYGRYLNSRGRGKRGPAFWFESLIAEIWKIVNTINNWPLTLFLCCEKKCWP